MTPQFFPITLPALVDIIYYLPDQYMELLGIRIERDMRSGLHQTFHFVREEYRAIGTWLQYLLLGYRWWDYDPQLGFQEMFAIDCTKTNKRHYEPLARQWIAIFELADQVWLHDSLTQQQYGNGNAFSFHIATERIQTDLKNSGLTGEPSVTGKSDLYRLAVNSLPDVAGRVIYSEQLVYPFQALVLRARAIALEDSDFLFQVYIPFRKAYLRSQRQIRDGKLSGVWVTTDGDFDYSKPGRPAKI